MVTALPVALSLSLCTELYAQPFPVVPRISPGEISDCCAEKTADAVHILSDEIISYEIISQEKDMICVERDSIAELRDSLEGARVSAELQRISGMEGPVERMGSGEIRALGYADPGEALRGFSGIELRDYGGAGGLRTVSVRGFGAQHTRVEIDGLPLSDLQSGMADLAYNNFVKHYNISVSIAGNEDIFKSASQMVAVGCVEMETEDKGFEKRPFSLGGMLRYGSFNTIGAQLCYDQQLASGRRKAGPTERSARGSGVILSAGLDYQGSDGDYPYTMNGDSSVRRRAGSGVQRLSPEFGLKAELGAGALRAKVLADFAERGLPGAAVLHNPKATEHLSERHCAALISFRGNEWGRWRLRSTLSWDYRHSHWSDTSAIYLTPAHEDYRQHSVLLSATALFDAGRGFRIAVAEDLGTGHLATTLPDCPFPTRLSSLSAISASFRHGIFSASGTIAASVIKDYVRSGDSVPLKLHFSPSVSAAVRLPAGFRIRASLRDGYRAPSFNELYWTRVGSRELRSEKAFQSNLGFNWSYSNRSNSAINLYASADAYCNLVRDKIVASPSLFIWSMHNIGRALMAGCDLNFGGSWSPFASRPEICLSLHCNYSWQHATDISDRDAANYGDQIRYIPRNSGSGHLSIETPWLRASYKLIAVGQRWFQDQNTPRSRLEPYWDHGISVGHAFHIRGLLLDLSFDALNLGGRNYEIIRSYPMPGRQFRGTIRLTI